ncbi:MAG: glycosyltransferase [Phycisphaerales bacterium]|nr:MAG: glycosyltransferase [Phycisphaerales bacterium]
MPNTAWIKDDFDPAVAVAERAAPSMAAVAASPSPPVADANAVATSPGCGHDAVRVLDAWRARNPYYHRRLTEYLRFIIPEGESVLMIGCEDGAMLSALRPSRGVGIDHPDELIACARRRHPDHEYATAPGYAFRVDGRFDYVVINDVMDQVHDVFALLQYVATRCVPTSRVIVIQPNYLWRPVHRMVPWLGAKLLRARSNLLSAGDLSVILQGVGFETIDIRPKLFCPWQFCGIGSAVNWVGGLLPFSHRLASTNILVARPDVQDPHPADKSASIVMAMRDERENVEPMVRAIPEVGRRTEILIVEGHSRDGTREEIGRVIEAYPQKNIRLVKQSGSGVANAIFEGFTAATGDVIILLEADRTSPPEDVLKVFDIIASGRADYVNGSRFIYPREQGAMPFPNVLGNALFAAWFMWFLGQRTSDVLCGLKGIDRRHFQRVLKHWGFLGVVDPFSDFEMVFGAARLGLKICEVPTRYTKRRYGRSKTRFFKHGWMLARMAARATRIFRCR